MSSGPLGGFPSGGSEGKNPPANAGDTGDSGSIPGSGRSPGVRAARTVFLPGKSHVQSLVHYRTWGDKESDTTEITQDQQKRLGRGRGDHPQS